MKKIIRNFAFLAFTLFFSLYYLPSANAGISGQPRNVTSCTASSAVISFSVKLDLFPLALGYQWEVYNAKLRTWVAITDQNTFGTLNISGSTTNTLTFTFGKGSVPLTTSYNGYTVHCLVNFGKGGVETSSAATLTVVAPPSITTQPVSLDRIVDESATFSVIASGSGLSYQWRKDGVNISGATSSSYLIKYVTVGDAGTYSCAVTNGICNAVISSGAALNVYPILTIDKHPGKTSACETKTASFSVVASNATGYQWEVLPYKMFEWIPINGATSSTFTTGALVPYDNNSQFRCVVAGGGGQSATSYAGNLTVYSNASITSHPASSSKIVGESVTFSISASGYITAYQWKFKGVNIPGATSSSYTIGSVQMSDAGAYTCTVSGCNSVTSNAATLTVTAATYPNGWYKQTSGSGLNILDVSPVSENVAWAVASDQDKLLYTINGGESWSSVITGYNGYWQSIKFLSSTTGMIGGSNGISRTTNSGTNWTYTDLRTGFGIANTNYFYIYSIQFSDALRGWFVGQGGIIAKTVDGGATWTKVSYKTDASPVTDIDLYTVFFADANTGYVAGVNGKMFKTTNGGTSWSELTTGTNFYIRDMSFTSATTGFFVTNSANKGIFKTTNGGTTWTQVTAANVNTYIYPNSIHFTDANNGWAAGYIYDGVQKVSIVKTFDGGLNWVSQKTTDLGYLSKIRMFSADHGWTVGSGGLILRTGKGGCYDPVVSLYADQTLCANQNYTLVADTFVNNYNSRYSWSTGVSTGKITVNTSDTYSVTITNECGKTATDNAVITFLPLPAANAGDDISICEGSSAQLNASGGSSYSWNNAGYLSDNLIPNPIATPPTGKGTTFTVTVTDDNGCSKTDAVVVTVNALPSSDFTAPTFVCGLDNGSFSYVGTPAGKSFAWDFDGGTIYSGSGAGPVNVYWTELGDKLISLTTTENNCSSAPTLKIVNIRVQPTSEFNLPESACGSSPAALIYTGNAPVEATYNWGLDGGTITAGEGQGPIQVSWATKGSKTVSLQVTQNSCVSASSENSILVSYPYELEQICLVTIDLETGKNMVVWEKTHDVGIASYNVYREGTIQGNYDLLGNVPFDEITVFVDSLSKPEQQQYKYKISAVDTCGNESVKSKWHKTMFLQYVSSDNGVNLNWQEYGVEAGSMNFDSYAIFRGSDSTALSELATISSSFLAFTDNTPLALSQRMYYRVGGVKAVACDPAELTGKKANSGPFVHSLSNLEDNRMQSTGISNHLENAINLSIYPSPFAELSTISYNLMKNSRLKVEVYNVVGEKVTVLLDESQAAGSHKLVMKASDVNYLNGLYYIRFMVDDAVIIRKTMLTR